MNAADLELITVGRVSIDFYAEQTGPMYDVRSFAKSVGGSSTNVAVAAARLGRRAATVTKVGLDDFGAEVTRALRDQFCVDTQFISTHPTLRTPLAIVERNPEDDPTVRFYREPSAPDSQLSLRDFAEVPVLNVPILWVSAALLAVEPSRSTAKEMLVFRARNTHTVIDLDWRAGFWTSETEAAREIGSVLQLATIVVGNRNECRIAVDSDDPEIAAERLLGFGLDAAVVKLGERGVYVALADGTRQLLGPHTVDVVSGVGAGDAFGGAFCDALLGQLPVVDCARRGNAAGAIVASRLGCAEAMPTREELMQFLAP